ncbi:efflux RND transporter periplasmic adaptor subunit [Cohnella fermenti]|uniref:efflux RND transporter periplasmic adaptor subunit n=1 Tax=Cohnella fermenti TaxID=2565925 RepID=UPI001E5889E9|nr:biotin/lipoyl-binding protein [Cohnella fermenti]
MHLNEPSHRPEHRQKPDLHQLHQHQHQQYQPHQQHRNHQRQPGEHLQQNGRQRVLPHLRQSRRLGRLFGYATAARLAALALTLGASLALTGCSLLPAEEGTLKPPLIQPTEETFDVVEAARGNIQTYLQGNVSFVSSAVESISFKESGGRLKAIHVALGDQVKAGDLLVELETGDLELQVKLQRLSVERAQLSYKSAKASGLEGDDLRYKEIDLERETLTLAALEQRLSQSRLYSPFSGTVTYVDQLKEGDGVSAYQSIVTVADPASMQLTYIAGNAQDLLPVEPGMPVSLKYKGKDYMGKVLQTPSNAPVTTDQAKADRNAVTMIMSMDGIPEGVNVGDVAEMRLELQKRENVIIIPRSAVRSYMGRTYVQIAEDDRRKEVDVEVGLTTSTAAEIVQGLEVGQKIILNN